MKLSERPLEYCFICDEPTGRAGAGEDSLYCDECDKGAYCPDCFRKHRESDEKSTQLETENATLKRKCEALLHAVAHSPVYWKVKDTYTELRDVVDTLLTEDHDDQT